MKKYLANKATMLAIGAASLFAGMSAEKAAAQEAPKAKHAFIALEVISATKSAAGDTVTMSLLGSNAGSLVRVGKSNTAYFADQKENTVNLDEQPGLKKAFDDVAAKKASKRTGRVRYNRFVPYNILKNKLL